MFVDGELWIPPDQITEDDDEVRDDPDEEEARLANRVRGFLGLSGQRKLLWLLRRAEGRRGSVARGMAYAIDRADAAEEVPSKFAISNNNRLWISLLRVCVLTRHPSRRKFLDSISSTISSITPPAAALTSGNTANCYPPSPLSHPANFQFRVPPRHCVRTSPYNLRFIRRPYQTRQFPSSSHGRDIRVGNVDDIQ